MDFKANISENFYEISKNSFVQILLGRLSGNSSEIFCLTFVFPMVSKNF